MPKMVCPKEIYNQELGCSTLKVMLRRGVSPQPIKILFENKGDMAIEA